MLAGLDDAPQPHALGVRGDVLDLVGDRAGVGLGQVRERVGERLARHVDPHELGRDGGHVRIGQAKRRRIEGGVAGRLRAERVEARGQVAEVAVRLHEGHPRGDGPAAAPRRPVLPAEAGAVVARLRAGTARRS